MKVTVRTGAAGEYFWRCYVTLPVIGRVVIATDRGPEQAQHQAAKFMDTNYPDLEVEWEGGYHGGDTSKRVGIMPSQYWGER